MNAFFMGYIDMYMFLTAAGLAERVVAGSIPGTGPTLRVFK